MKELPWLGLEDNIENKYKMWTSVTSPKSVSDEIRVEIFNWYFKSILLGIFGFSKIVLSENKMIDVADSSKLV